MPAINNAFYDDLGDRWFEGDDHAIALLRVESQVKIDYVLDLLPRLGIETGATILDVACGAGLVSLPLAEAGYRVHGVDLSAGSIATAQARAVPGATFAVGDAYALDAGDASVDAVLLLDMLEHVERPAEVLAEAARVVRPGGAVIFHTFNRTPLSWLFAIHGFRFVVRDIPDHVHVYRLFVPPEDLRQMGEASGLDVREVVGVRPSFKAPLWRSILQRRIAPGFHFVQSGPPWIGYIGHAVRTLAAEV